MNHDTVQPRTYTKFLISSQEQHDSTHHLRHCLQPTHVFTYLLIYTKFLPPWFIDSKMHTLTKIACHRLTAIFREAIGILSISIECARCSFITANIDLPPFVQEVPYTDEEAQTSSCIYVASHRDAFSHNFSRNTCKLLHWKFIGDVSNVLHVTVYSKSILLLFSQLQYSRSTMRVHETNHQHFSRSWRTATITYHYYRQHLGTVKRQ